MDRPVGESLKSYITICRPVGSPYIRRHIYPPFSMLLQVQLDIPTQPMLLQYPKIPDLMRFPIQLPHQQKALDRHSPPNFLTTFHLVKLRLETHFRPSPDEPPPITSLCCGSQIMLSKGLDVILRHLLRIPIVPL